MSRFTKGQRVRVEIEGTVASYHDDGGGEEGVSVTTGNGVANHYVHLGIAGSPKGTVSVTVLDPPGWPPQEGDIWEAEGREYYVSQWMDEKIIVHPFRVTDDNYSYCDARGYMKKLDEFKALSPALVRRRGQ